MSYLARALRAAAALSFSICLTSSAMAQTTVSVGVNASTTLATIPAQGWGLNTAVWDGNLLDGAIPNLLSRAGVAALRYPGGSTSDVYNWQTNSIVPGQGSYANPSNNFDAFMALAKSIGAAPIITVNYGSNQSGNGGGDPAYAAAWVSYAKSKGYGVKYWEIGNEVYGNGQYGSAWETDLHAQKDPATYGRNVVQFANAMKAADPTIKIGAVLAAPGKWPDGQSPDWNSAVLAQCASVIDFVVVHWYPQEPYAESDGGLLAAPQDPSSGIASMATRLKALINQYGGARAPNIQFLVTETNSVTYNPGKQTLSAVNAMFIADNMLTWAENGAASVDVWALHNGPVQGNASSSLFGSTSYGDYGVLSNGQSGEPAANTPFPAYYGMRMASYVGKAGDTLVASTSSSSLLTTHAARLANGGLAVLLINKDRNDATTANVTISGYTPGGTADRLFLHAVQQFDRIEQRHRAGSQFHDLRASLFDDGGCVWRNVGASRHKQLQPRGQSVESVGDAGRNGNVDRLSGACRRIYRQCDLLRDRPARRRHGELQSAFINIFDDGDARRQRFGVDRNRRLHH